MRLSKPELVGVLRDLAAIYPSKSRTDFGTLAEAYHAALDDISPDELRAASKIVMREDSFFPKPARLRAAALSIRGGPILGDHATPYGEWLTRMDGPCPLCQAVPQCWQCGSTDHTCPCQTRMTITHDWRLHRPVLR